MYVHQSAIYGCLGTYSSYTRRNGSVLAANNLEARTRLCQISLVPFGVVTLHPPTFSVFPIFLGLTTCSLGSVFTIALLYLSLSPKSHTTEGCVLPRLGNQQPSH
ncbi:hypothetical protein M434DRAFT_262153 [Hypoxylon sp. CO27-5]|nr:hypothetical protein M434DRAFT_262153 [Hypoxylon sp. CO27-5]